MINKITIGVDEGSYSLSGKDITLSGLSFTPVIEGIAYIYNKTQDVLYYAPAENLARVSLAGNVVTIDSSFDDLGASDVLHIQFWIPQRAYDSTYDVVKSIEQGSLDLSASKVIDITNGAAATTNYEIDLDGFNSLSLFYSITAGAGDTVEMKYFATNKSDADLSTDTYWVDITQLLTENSPITVGNSTTAKDIDFVDTKFVVEKMKVQITITGGTSNIVELWVKKQLSS